MNGVCGDNDRVEATASTLADPGLLSMVASIAPQHGGNDTAQGGTKPATLETGAVVQVPLFVEEGEVIRVDRREDKYLTRVTE